MSFLTHIKMLALDVDGVMTDGIIYYSPSGDAMKGFSARDGMGISLIRAAGIQTALVTGRRSPMVEQRAKDLHIDYVSRTARASFWPCSSCAVKSACPSTKWHTWATT